MLSDTSKFDRVREADVVITFPGQHEAVNLPEWARTAIIRESTVFLPILPIYAANDDEMSADLFARHLVDVLVLMTANGHLYAPVAALIEIFPSDEAPLCEIERRVLGCVPTQ